MDELLIQLRERAEKTFGAAPIAEVIGKTKAIIGVTKLPAQESDAQTALTKLQQGQEPTPTELAALEVMVRLMRPAPLSKAGALDDLPKFNQYNADLVAAWQNFRPRVRDYLYSVGRLDLADGRSVGTGFLVGENLLVTNNHVLEALSFGTGRLETGQAFIRFKQEFDCHDDEGRIPVESAVASQPALDIALLRIGKLPSRVATPFLLETAAVIPGDNVVALGYPFEDRERNPIFVPNIFESTFGVKRAAPGQVVAVHPPDLFHDCSTLGGNSGSPVVSMATARVVGLHRSGFFMYRNAATDAASLASFIAKHQ